MVVAKFERDGEQWRFFMNNSTIKLNNWSSTERRARPTEKSEIMMTSAILQLFRQ